MKPWMRELLLILPAPIAVIAGAVLLDAQAFVWVSLIAAVLFCLPFFIRFERKPVSTPELVLVAVMTALSVAGRYLFAFLPSVKPVAALVIVTGMYCGGEAGFLTGALTALISNLYFGQGMWTPFQMLGWGLIGLAAGWLSHPLRRHVWLQAVFAAVAGVGYSAILDVWTVLWLGRGFSLLRYGAAIAASAGATVSYAVSNVLFLAVLFPVAERVFPRVRMRYGLDPLPPRRKEKSAAGT